VLQLADENNLIITVNLDDTGVNKTLKELGKNGQETAKELEQAFKENINENVEKLSESIRDASKSQDVFQKVLKSSTATIVGFAAFVGNFGDELSKIFGGLTARIGGFNKGVFGLTFALSAAGASFDILTEVLKESNNQFVRSLATFTKIAGFIAGGFSFGLTLLITKIGDLTFEVGSRLVRAFDNAAQAFVETEKQTRLLAATVDAFNRALDGAVGSNELFTKQIQTLSKELNITQNDLRESAREIISVGTRLGLTSDQLLELNRIVAEYAKLQGKDVVQTSVAFVSALNGQSQAVTAYGVKLNEASNQQFLLKKEIDKNFKSLTESSKVQVRYNNLIDQFATVSGIASSTSDTLAEQQERLRVNQEALATAFGRGASAIEQNNLVAFGLNKILETVNEEILAFTGFVGSLGARVLQITGFLLSFSFQIIAVTKAIKLLNIALNTNIAQALLVTNLPLLNQSLLAVIQNLAGASVQIRSFGDILRAVALIATTSLKRLPVILLNIARGASVALIPFLPLIAKLTILVGVFSSLSKAFRIIQRETQFFTKALNLLSDAFGFGEKVNFVTQVFRNLGETIARVSRIIVGGLIFALAELFNILNKIAQSKIGKTVLGPLSSGINDLNNDLQGLSKRLVAANFDFAKFGSAALASGEGPKKLKKDLVEVKKELELTGQAFNKSTLQTFATLGGTFSGFAELTFNAFRLFSENINKVNEFSKEELQQLANVIGGTFARGVTNSIASVTKALASGQNAFEALGKSVLNLIGDLAISIGQFTIATGVAKLALESLPGGATIAAGVGLVALGTLLKTLSGNSFVGGGVQGGFNQNPNGINNSPFPQIDQVQPGSELERQTAVTVNVEGTVLDPVGVGQQISEILDEAFNAGASTIQVNSA
jgi:hypothetical protein